MTDRPAIPAPVRGVRRANALVLVTAILVLLVIIATAFLVRSRAVRAQAAATQQAAGRTARVESVVRDLAQGIGDALFVRRIDSTTYQAQVQANQATGLTVPGLGQFMARSDFPLLPPYPFAIRYEVDMFDGGEAPGSPGFDNRYLGPYVASGESPLERSKVDGYNYAPFSVSPFTNWPLRYGDVQGETDFRDWYTPPLSQPTAQPPAPWPQNFRIPTNPRGNPGFGDHRWLASTEPARAQVDGIDATQDAAARAKAFPLVLENGSAKVTPEGLGFSHWPHLSWIANANNGFRACWDISDIDANTLDGAAGTAEGEMSLGTPYEQWLPWIAPRELSLAPGWTDPQGYLAVDWRDFRRRWARWFNRDVPAVLQFPNTPIPPLTAYPAAAGGLPGNTGHMQVIKGVNAAGEPQAGLRNEAPPNFLQLAAYGSPADEFKVFTQADEDAGRVPAGYDVGFPRPRNLIARTLADADGDGWTDSLWFASPTSADRGTRQVVAVRIMDNSALLNVNVATRFERSNTIGQTPADLALVSRRESYDLSTAQGRQAAAFDPAVGFLSAPENDPEWRTNVDEGRVAIVPTRSPSTPPSVDALYQGGWSLLRADRLFSGQAMTMQSSDYFAVYRTSKEQAIEVAFAPERFEGRRKRGLSDDSPATVNNVTLPGYFGRQSILGELGVIREGRAGDGGSSNALIPDFAIGTDYGTPSPNGDFFALTRVADRATYFKAMQSGGAILDPVIAAKRAELTPFGIDDEMELRGFNGCNDPQTVSRLESAIGGSYAAGAGEQRPLDQFLRSSRSREETSRFLPALDPRQQDAGVRQVYLSGALGADRAARSGTELLLDHRRKLTTVSGARNDMLPPRLWTLLDYRPQVVADEYRFLTALPAYDAARTNDGTMLLPPYHPNRMFPAATLVPAGGSVNPWGAPVADVNGDGFIKADDFLLARQRFLNDNRKIDLRRPSDSSAPLDDPRTPTFDDRLSSILDEQDRFSFDIQRVLRSALIDIRQPRSISPSSAVQPVFGDSYFSRPGASRDPGGELEWAANWTRAMAASYAANLLCYRDGGRPTQIVTGIPAVTVDQPLYPLPREAVQWPEDVPVPEPIRQVGGQFADPANGKRSIGYIGVEAHPVIMEVFVAAVYPPNRLDYDEVTDAWQEFRADNTGDTTIPADCPLSDELFEDDEYRLAAAADWPNGTVAKPVEAGLFNASFRYPTDEADTAEFGPGGGAPAFVLVVQIANPFNVPVKLADYEIRLNGTLKQSDLNPAFPPKELFQSFQFVKSDKWCDPQQDNPPGSQGAVRWGNTYGPDVELGPCTPEEPRTAIVFAIPERFPNGLPFPREAWLDFFDLGRSVDRDADAKGRSDLSVSGGGNALSLEYPRQGQQYFPAGRWFQPDQSALFRPAWGSDAALAKFRRGGTLLFDATATLSVPSGTGSTVVERSTPAFQPGSGFRVVPRRRSDLKAWEPRDDSSAAGRPSYIELIRKVVPLKPNTEEPYANVVVDRFENQVDPQSDRVRSNAANASGGVGATAGATFGTLLRRTLPSPTDPDRAKVSVPPPTSIRFRKIGSSYRMQVDGTRFIDPDSQDPQKITQDELETLANSGDYPLSCLVTWARGSRQWLRDVDGDGYVASDERTPRFAFARMASVMGSALLSDDDPSTANPDGGGREVGGNWGNTVVGDSQNQPQFAAAMGTLFAPDRDAGSWWSHFSVLYRSVVNKQLRGSKPSFLSTRAFDDGAGRRYPRPTDADSNVAWWGTYGGGYAGNGVTASYGEKGASDPRRTAPGQFENFNAPLRLFQKDADLDQVAELLDVPMWGPLVGLVKRDPTSAPYDRHTFVTLPEVLAMPQNVPPTSQQPTQGDGSQDTPVYGLLFPMSARSVLADRSVQGHWLPHDPSSPQGAEVLDGPRYGSWQQQVNWNRLSVTPATYTRLTTEEVAQISAGAGPDSYRLALPTQLQGNQVLPSSSSQPGVVPAPQQNGIGFNTRLPGVAALLDAFTLDDRGAASLDENGDNSISPIEWGKAEDRRLRLAAGFSGQRTAGLINVNTAPIEVLRAMPHMTRLGYFDDYPIRVSAESDPATLSQRDSQLGLARLIRGTDAEFAEQRLWERSPAERSLLPNAGTNGGASPFPTVRVASAIESYRNKLNPVVYASEADQVGTWTYPDSPSYVDRGAQLGNDFKHREFAPGMRSERGFESLGELALLVRGASGVRGDEDANNNGILDVREVAMGLAVDVNQNGVPDPTNPVSSTFQPWDQAPNGGSWSWGGAMSWSIRYGGMDPFRTNWESDNFGLGARSRDILAEVNAPAGYTQGVPLAAGQGREFTFGGRTAIDPHLLVAATDDSFTSAVETNDPGTVQVTESRSVRFDRTSGDALEQNQLLRGISNIATTRSDVFTMWVRVRTVKQDPLTGKWDATDPELILDDSRYVLTIDRSNVDRPGDAPRILGMVKVPK